MFQNRESTIGLNRKIKLLVGKSNQLSTQPAHGPACSEDLLCFVQISSIWKVKWMQWSTSDPFGFGFYFINISLSIHAKSSSHLAITTAQAWEIRKIFLGRI